MSATASKPCPSPHLVFHVAERSAFFGEVQKCAAVVGTCSPNTTLMAIRRCTSRWSALAGLLDALSAYPRTRNFGSLDGDSAAAYRYTEAGSCRSPTRCWPTSTRGDGRHAAELTARYSEPSVLPVRLPYLLVDGTLGIAVGMATNIPLHNLGEICDAIAPLIENPDIERGAVGSLKARISRPAASSTTSGEIRQAYATGKGGIVMRAKTEIVEGRAAIRIPRYGDPAPGQQVYPHRRSAELVRGRIEGIRDLRDESAKGEVRIVVELKEGCVSQEGAQPALQAVAAAGETFHVNMLALVDGIQPRVLTLKNVLEGACQASAVGGAPPYGTDLSKAKDRAHLGGSAHRAPQDRRRYRGDQSRRIAKRPGKFDVSSSFPGFGQCDLGRRLSQLTNLERLRVEQNTTRR